MVVWDVWDNILFWSPWCSVIWAWDYLWNIYIVSFDVLVWCTQYVVHYTSRLVAHLMSLLSRSLTVLCTCLSQTGGSEWRQNWLFKLTHKHNVYEQNSLSYTHGSKDLVSMECLWTNMLWKWKRNKNGYCHWTVAQCKWRRNFSWSLLYTVHVQGSSLSCNHKVEN